MRISLILLCFGCLLALGYGQNDGKYRPSPAELTTQRPRYNPYIDGRYVQYPYNPYRYPTDSRYYNRNDGRYIARNDGRYYGGNDGRYVPGNDGQYVHVDNKYKHVDGKADSGARIQRDSVGASNGTKSGTNGDERETTKPETVLSAILPIPTPPPNVIRMYRLPQPSLGGKRMYRLENQIEENGYHYIYQKADGIVAEETGRIERSGTPGEKIYSQGTYQYDEDGEFYQVKYTAVGNSYRPEGDHVPKVPPAIERLLRYLASQPK
ncbi:larval cuticle protein LCP-30-like isoform X3 [Anopheles aquasalis]|uniref:larval cuticle protein LCP-30-like isoform X2 n=1 Tax=Anopheles aquasalis TaxID=42839 RepID=UPI00215AA94E|nr:larval cuticle protein LCP-30-like isoform X2 [Anopheles aquasalis]XP_050087246.1 larval cuticle protein LCP-30-like isoform X3 [Anopheles aquasalis]